MTTATLESTMAKKHKITDAKTIDDILETVHDTPREKDIDKALAHYDEYMEDENQNHVFNNIVAPSVDEFYKGFTESLDKSFHGDENAKLRAKKDEVQEAVVHGLEKYFEKAMPSVLEAVKDVDDMDERYEILSHHYDALVLGSAPGSQQPEGLTRLSDLVQAFTKGKKSTVGHLKRRMYDQRSVHVGRTMRQLNSRATTHHTGHIPDHVLAKHLKPLVEKIYEIGNLSSFYTLPGQHLLNIRDGIKTNQWMQDTGPDTYELLKKEKNEKKAHKKEAVHH